MTPENVSVAALMMRIVENRHTSNAEDFVQLTVDLVRAAKREQAALLAPRDPSPPLPAAVAEVAANSQRHRGERDTPPAAPPKKPPRNKPRKASAAAPSKRAALSDELKPAMEAEIRARYQDALRNKTGKQLPRGFVDALAAEYGLSKKKIYNIGHYKPKTASAQKPAAAAPKAATEGRPAQRAIASPAAPAKTLTDAEKEELCEQYEKVREGGAPLPARWIDDKAAAHGVDRKLILAAVAPAVERLSQRARDNHALSTPPPRADRFAAREVAGSYGGG